MLWRIAKRTASGFMADEALDLSAGLAYRFFLAVVPFFIFLAALSGFVTTALRIPDVAQRIDALISSTVPANVGSLLTDELEAILTNREPGALSFSVVFTLFAANSATLALMKAMNTAYDVPESRGLPKKYAVSLGLTLLAAVLVIASFSLLVVARFFASGVASLLGLGEQYHAVIGVAPLPLIFIALAVASGILYRFGPNITVTARSVVPGAIFFPVTWLAATYGFSLYVDGFGSYEKTYGALAAVVIFLIWLYINGVLLIAGAELNAAVANVTRPSETEVERRKKDAEARRRAA